MSSNASVASSTNIWSTNNNSDDSDNDFDNLNEIQEGEEKTVETKNNEEELEKKLKELQKQKSVYKKPVEDLLCSMNGLDKIYHHFPHLIKPFPVGQEGAFLKKLLSLYSEWGYQLDPKTHFNDLIIKCESVGMKGKIRGELLRLREIEKKRRIVSSFFPYSSLLTYLTLISLIIIISFFFSFIGKSYQAIPIKKTSEFKH